MQKQNALLRIDPVGDCQTSDVKSARARNKDDASGSAIFNNHLIDLHSCFFALGVAIIIFLWLRI
jgi:hypothetical protein